MSIGERRMREVATTVTCCNVFVLFGGDDFPLSWGEVVIWCDMLGIALAVVVGTDAVTKSVEEKSYF